MLSNLGDMPSLSHMRNRIRLSRPKRCGKIQMDPLPDLRFYAGQLAVGISHRFHKLIDGAKFGGSYDVPAYTPDSYTRPGVPQGHLSEKRVNISKVYDGMQSDYWVLLGLCPCPIRSYSARSVDGPAGWGKIHNTKHRRAMPPVPESLPASGSYGQPYL